MPGNLVQVGFTAMCPHGGSVSIVSSNTRVLLGNQPAGTLADNYLIAGCPFVLLSSTPSPCVRVQWLAPATRVLVNGQPAILQTSSGLCLAATQAPQGPPSVAATQMRVQGT